MVVFQTFQQIVKKFLPIKKFVATLIEVLPTLKKILLKIGFIEEMETT